MANMPDIERNAKCYRNKQRPTKLEQVKPVDSETALVRESATIMCVLAETQRQADNWESFIEAKGKASGLP